MYNYSCLFEEFTMGQSTDGILCYGFDVNEEGPEIPYSMDELFLKIHGIDADELDYKEQKAKLEELNFDDCPIEIIDHCSEGCRMVILGIKGKSVTASRGYPEDINVNDLIPNQKEIQLAKDFIQNNEFFADMDIDKDPKLMLCSWWG